MWLLIRGWICAQLRTLIASESFAIILQQLVVSYRSFPELNALLSQSPLDGQHPAPSLMHPGI